MLVAIVAAVIAGAFTLGAAAIESRRGRTLGGVLVSGPTATATITATATVTVTPSPGPSAAASSSESAEQTDATKPGPLFLSDIPSDRFVRRSFGSHSRPITIDGHEYANSYSYEFSNCSNCTSVDEVKIDRAYTHLSGVFGLTDDSRHDDTIDGVVYASIYSGSTLIYGPKKIEYPDSTRFNLKIQTSRITLKVSAGTNSETAAWADVKLT
jgi:hypothetical protein